jgi:hypothetical protein
MIEGGVHHCTKMEFDRQYVDSYSPVIRCKAPGPDFAMQTPT